MIYCCVERVFISITGYTSCLLFSRVSCSLSLSGRVQWYDIYILQPASEGFIVKPIGADFDKPVNKYIDGKLKAQIDERIYNLLNTVPLLYPVQQEGKAVPFQIDGLQEFHIKVHHILGLPFN